MITLLVLAAANGGIIAFLPEESAAFDIIEFAAGLVMLILITSWCYYDAVQRQIPLSRGMRVWLVLFFAVAFPIYLFKSRGFGGFRGLAHAAVFLCAMVGTLFLAGVSCSFMGSFFGVIE